MLALLVLITVVSAGMTARANGGTVRVSHAAAGPFALTVFTDPTPLRAGPVDVSVPVQTLQT